MSAVMLKSRSWPLRIWDRWLISRRIRWAEYDIAGLEWQQEVDRRRLDLLHKHLAELRVLQAISH